MPILEVVEVHWPDDECLSQSFWIKILNMCGWGVVLKMVDLAIDDTHMHEICFLLQVVMTFYELQTMLE